MIAFKDDRGRSYNNVFQEVINGDINVAVLYPGTIKAFHRHQRQDDWWFVAKGQLRAVTVFVNSQNYPEVRVHYLSEGELLHIPRNIWHGLQVLGNEEVVMMYHITNKYNPTNPDEERAPYNEFFDWSISRK